ncbi:hypothetical protein Hdeb2414_s0426g00891171 [Helianthus debilis subsp. tardiflorus]
MTKELKAFLSDISRALMQKSGGITSLVSPCPVTLAVLLTPIWGVDRYGSMKGLIRLRSPGNEVDATEDEEDKGGSTESDVEEHVEAERRLDYDIDLR